MRYKRFVSLTAAVAFVAFGTSWSRAAENEYLQKNLVSDKTAAAKAAMNDPFLLNPWGMANIAGGPFWISDNGSGFASLYDGLGKPIAQLPKVLIPPSSGTVKNENGTPGSPDGIVWNGNFLQFLVPKSATAANPLSIGNTCIFIFATEDGTISCWAPGNLTNPAIIVSAQIIIDNSDDSQVTGPVYKGLATGTNSRDTFIYATDFRDRKIVAWNSMFGFDAQLTAAFQDGEIPKDFAPFGIQNINGDLWVTYAKQDTSGHDPVEGKGLGFVDIFDTNGNLLRRFAEHGKLDAPWGVVLAPDNFGRFSNDILIGNFGDGTINAYNPRRGKFKDQLRDEHGHVIVNASLWVLVFGGGAQGSDSGVLYFTAGLVNEQDGLFGTLTPTP
jgi:uncharacterized protein (TIGR03118 family)